MFSRRERLPRAQFTTALRNGRRVSSEHFMLIIPKESTGYAVVIPKKVVRLSVTRHRLKRQIFEVLRALPLPPSLIVFPRSSIHSVNYQDMLTELRTILSNLHT